MKIIRNMIVLNVGCFVFFSAYQGMINLQSTINAERNLGVFALFVLYSFLAFASLMLPTLMMEKFGYKSVLILGCVGYIPYMAANFYPVWEIFMPSAALAGVAAALFWSARAAYTNGLSLEYAIDRQRTQDAASALFFGINSVSWSLAYVFGNAVSSFVLHPDEYQEQPTNSSKSCGSNFREDFNRTNPNLVPLSDEKRLILIGVYIACFVLAASLFQFGLTLPFGNKMAISHKHRLSLLLASIKLFRNKKQLLLLPLTFYLGISSGFFFAAYTKAFIGCAIGIHEIGRVMASYGLACAFISGILGKVANHIGYPIMLSSAMVMHFSTFVALLTWKPDNEIHWPYYAIAIAWAYADAIWWTLLAAYYGIVFREKKEAAFSNFYFLNGVGFLSSFASQGFLTVDVLIYLTTGILLLGMTGFFIVEISIRRTEEANKIKEEKHPDGQPPLNHGETTTI